MRKKSCLNCAYLGRDNAALYPVGVKIIALPEGERVLSEGVASPGLNACFHDQWKRDYAFHSPRKETLAEEQSKKPDEVLIMTQSNIILSLGKHSCKYFYPFKRLGTRTLEQCWKEQQESKTTSHSWIRFILSLIKN